VTENTNSLAEIEKLRNIEITQIPQRCPSLGNITINHTHSNGHAHKSGGTAEVKSAQLSSAQLSIV
jgi:hypothetical protein